jgi:uncharacterized repeat protein (TIGR01451 family)
LSTSGAANNATLNSTANTANETDTGSTVVVSAGEVIALGETLGAGNTGSYTASAWSCSGTTGLSGSTLTVGGTDTAIVCAITNSRQTTDLQMTKSVTPTTAVRPGQVLTYTLLARNNGPGAAANAVISDTPSAGLDCTTPSTTATCAAAGGAVCPGATVPVSTLLGSGIVIPTLPAGGTVALTLLCTVTATGRP